MVKQGIYIIDNLNYQIVWKKKHAFGRHKQRLDRQIAMISIFNNGKKWYVLGDSCERIYLSLDDIYQYIYLLAEKYYQESFGDDFDSFESFSFDLDLGIRVSSTISLDGKGKQ